MYDVAIIGGGVIGASIARELSRYALDIVVVEKTNDVANGTSKANSAIVHAGYDAPYGSKKGFFNKKGSDLYESICKELDVNYERAGSFVVGFSEEDRATLDALKTNGDKLGIKGLEVVDRAFVLEKEPNISDDVQLALYAPSAAITDPFGLTIAYMENAMDNGVSLILNFEVKEIIDQKTAYLLKSETDTIEAKFVINAAGLYSDEIYKMVDPTADFKIIPKRGQYYLLDKTAEELVNSVIFQCPSALGKGVVVAPTVDGNILVGPDSQEVATKNDIQTTRERMMFIKESAKRAVAHIPYGENITTFSGLRAEPSHDDFLIEAVNAHFYNVAGIKSPGLSAAPAIAKHVAKEVAGMLSAEINSDFDPIRKYVTKFSELNIEEKNAMIKENPLYGKVVCRCENITEGEIVASIHRNCGGETVNGIKRRVRPGAGRCQGGFCMPKVVEILARELKVEQTDILKENKGSHILVGRTKAGELCTR